MFSNKQHYIENTCYLMLFKGTSKNKQMYPFCRLRLPLQFSRTEEQALRAQIVENQIYAECVSTCSNLKQITTLACNLVPNTKHINNTFIKHMFQLNTIALNGVAQVFKPTKTYEFLTLYHFESTATCNFINRAS